MGTLVVQSSPRRQVFVDGVGQASRRRGSPSRRLAPSRIARHGIPRVIPLNVAAGAEVQYSIR